MKVEIRHLSTANVRYPHILGATLNHDTEKDGIIMNDDLPTYQAYFHRHLRLKTPKASEKQRRWNRRSRSGLQFLGSHLLAVIFALMHPAISSAKDPPFVLPAKVNILKLRTALIETTAGKMVFELFPEFAPWHVANFKYLADKGYYSGTSFTIYEPHYIIQGGKSASLPLADVYSIEPEFSPLPHERGVLGMARKADVVNSYRRSDGHQFHILLTRAPHMDGNYTIFGRLARGATVLDRLRKETKILKVTVFVRDTDTELKDTANNAPQ